MPSKKSAQDPLQRLWETAALRTRSPSGTASSADLSDSQLEQLIAFYPVALRRQLGTALDTVHKLAHAGHVQADAVRLLRLFRSTGDLMPASAPLPVSPQLWAALALLDQAFEEMKKFKSRPQDYLSTAQVKRLRSAISRANAKAPRKRAQKRDGSSTAAASSQGEIWEFLRTNGYGGGVRRGVGTGLVAEAMKKFSVSESKVRRAISCGKKGLFDAG